MRTLLIVLIGAILFTSCAQPATSDAKIQKAQEAILQQANDQVGMPAILNFQEKKMMKQIYELRDQEKLICYAYFYNEYNGKLVFFGKCLGYGIPYATQYSSAQKLSKSIYSDGTSEAGPASIPMQQAEPNGLFMPEAAEGTWLLMLDKNGVPHPVYSEPKVIVSPFELSI
jgi:hypothetical protein